MKCESGMSFLSQIPPAAYGFMSVALFCGTYIHKGGVANYGPLNGISFQQLENKVDKNTIDIVTKLQISATKITRKLDKIENDVQDINNRFRKTEENVQNARVWNIRHMAAIDPIVGKLKISLSEKEIDEHFIRIK